MDVEEKQEMLDVGVKKSDRDAPSSVGCVPCWRLVWLHDVFFVCSGGWQTWNLSNLLQSLEVGPAYMMSSLMSRCKILHLPYMA